MVLAQQTWRYVGQDDTGIRIRLGQASCPAKHPRCFHLRPPLPLQERFGCTNERQLAAVRAFVY